MAVSPCAHVPSFSAPALWALAASLAGAVLLGLGAMLVTLNGRAAGTVGDVPRTALVPPVFTAVPATDLIQEGTEEALTPVIPKAALE